MIKSVTSEFSENNVFQALYEDNDFFLLPYTEDTIHYHSNTDILQESKESEISHEEYISQSSGRPEYDFGELHKQINDISRSASQTTQYMNRSKHAVLNDISRSASQTIQYMNRSKHAVLNDISRSASQTTQYMNRSKHAVLNDISRSASQTTQYKNRSKHARTKRNSYRTEDNLLIKNYSLSDLDHFRECLKGVGRNPFKYFHFSILYIRARAYNCTAPPLVSCSSELERKHAAARIISNCWHKFVYRTVYIYLKHLIQCYNRMKPSILRFINPCEASLALDPAVSPQLRFRLGGSHFPPVVFYRIYTTCPVVCVHFRNRKGKRHCRDSHQHSKDFNWWRPWKDRYSTFPLSLKPKNTRMPTKRNLRSHSQSMLSNSKIYSEPFISLSSSTLQDFSNSNYFPHQNSRKHLSKSLDRSTPRRSKELSLKNLPTLEEEELELLTWVQSI